MKNTDETAKWTKRYQTALRRYLQQEMPSNLKPALKLGQEAAALNLDIPSLARIHKKTLTGLKPNGESVATRKSWGDKAQLFFTETVVPIEKKHESSMTSAARLQRMNKILQKRRAESKNSALLLEQSVIKRQKAEAALDMSEKKLLKLGKESSQLNALLRKKTHEILKTQEQEKQKNNLLLLNEVAQALLAIDIRLLGLKKSTENNTRKFSKELDDTQRMMRESLATIKGILL
jgi:hypothetical protein